MQDYQVPQEETSLDFAYWLDYAVDHQRHTPPAMQPCKNIDCSNKSFAIFCSEACRVTYEGDDTEDYYRDDQSNVTLGHRQTADQQWQQDQQAGGFAALVCGAQPQVAPAVVPVPAFPEAPVSCTVKGFRHGQDTMMTIRGTDFASVQAQIEAATQWFDAVAVPAKPVRPTQEEPDEDSFCHVHNVPLRYNPGRNGESGWFSHKGPDGWCKGKAKGGHRG